MKTTVILMAYGSPTTLEEVPEYLVEIYEGRPVPDYAMKENMEKYRMVDGVSPSNAIIDSIVKKLKSRLSRHGNLNVVLGNKHWKPFLRNVVSEMLNDPPEMIVGIPLFPFPSINVLNSYSLPLREALESLNLHTEVRMVNGLDLNGLADIWAGIIKGMHPSDGEAILLDAHSLPTFRNPEPEYDNAFKTISGIIAGKIGVDTYYRGYQSIGKYGNSWLGPTVYDQFKKIQENGHTSVLAAPIGFLYEHLEVLYDLDLEFGKETVLKRGLGYRRTPLPDSSESIVNLLEMETIKALGGSE